MNLKDHTTVVAALSEGGYPIDVVLADGFDDTVWLFGHEHGVSKVICANSFEAAWEAAVDASPTIDPSEVYEAYGFDSKKEFNRAIEDANDDGEDGPELVEGYEMQSNSSGTGIVRVGHYAWLHAYERDNESDRETRLVIRSTELWPPTRVHYRIGRYSFEHTECWIELQDVTIRDTRTPAQIVSAYPSVSFSRIPAT